MSEASDKENDVETDGISSPMTVESDGPKRVAFTEVPKKGSLSVCT